MSPKLNFHIRLLTILAFLIVLLIPAAAYAQSGIDLVVHYVEGTPLEGKPGYQVSIYLSALQANGAAISGLTRDDFKVSEDSRQVEIDSLGSASDLPMSVLVLMDTSGSMQGTAIQDARRAAGTFISGLGEQDQVAAATFNEKMTYLSDFTDDRETVSSEITKVSAVNLASTCLYDAAYDAVQKAATLESGRRAIVLLTDGQDYKSGGACSVHTLDDVIGLAADAATRVPVFTIGLGKEIDEKSLQRLAEMSGGVYRFAPSSGQLLEVFNALSSQLRSQYVLTYTSTGAPGAHTVAVEMKYDDQSVQDTRRFTLPELPITLTIISPTDGQEIKGNAKLAVSLSGSGQAVEKVVFKLGDEEIASDATLPYELDYAFGNDQLGGQSLTAAALDADGNELAAASVGINVKEAAKDATSPVETTKSLFDNPLYIALGAGGLALVGVVVFFLLRSRKKAEPVFTDAFELRQEPRPGEDRTIDISLLGSEGLGRAGGEAIATLTVLASDDAGMIGQQLSINKFPATVGRSAKNDIVISQKDQPVSRDHIIIDQRSGRTVLMEAVSADPGGNPKRPTYGTYINEKRVGDENVPLKDGDEIRLGSRFRIRFSHVRPSGGSEDRTMDGIDLGGAGKTREIDREEGGTHEIPRD